MTEKIRNKDPILFGQLEFQPKRLYYIADWIDEHCDLTLDKFVEAMKVDNPEFSISEIEEITPEGFEKIKKEVIERHQRLEDTNSSTWRKKIREEERKILEEELEYEEQKKEDAAKLSQAAKRSWKKLWLA